MNGFEALLSSRLWAWVVHPGLLAGGALLAAVPLAIHWWSRRRVRTIDWAAMRLLAREFPSIPLVAAFETGFHQSIPPSEGFYAVLAMLGLSASIAYSLSSARRDDTALLAQTRSACAE